LAVGRYVDAQDRPTMAGRPGLVHLARGDVPAAEHAVLAAGDQFSPVARTGEDADRRLKPAVLAQLLVRSYVVKADHAAFSGDGQALLIDEHQGQRHGRAQLAPMEALARGRAPKDNAVVGVGGGEHLPVGREGQGTDGATVSETDVPQRAGG